MSRSLRPGRVWSLRDWCSQGLGPPGQSLSLPWLLRLWLATESEDLGKLPTEPRRRAREFWEDDPHCCDRRRQLRVQVWTRAGCSGHRRRRTGRLGRRSPTFLRRKGCEWRHTWVSRVVRVHAIGTIVSQVSGNLQRNPAQIETPLQTLKQ